MRARHDADEILQAAQATALAEGLSRLTYGRVAARLGIPDRTVVYYFPTKDDLVGAVLAALGEQLTGALAAAYTDTAADHRELVRAAWPVLARPEADPIFALYFEAIGLAAIGRAPFDELVPPFVEGWIEWTAALVTGSPAVRRREAEVAVALIDGLLLLRAMAGAEVADRAAAAALGTRRRPTAQPRRQRQVGSGS